MEVEHVRRRLLVNDRERVSQLNRGTVETVGLGRISFTQLKEPVIKVADTAGKNT